MPDRREFLGAVAGVAAGAMLPAACDCGALDVTACDDFEIVEIYSVQACWEERLERLMYEVAEETKPDGWMNIVTGNSHQHLLRSSFAFRPDAAVPNVLHGEWEWHVDAREIDHLTDESAKQLMRLRRDAAANA